MPQYFNKHKLDSNNYTLTPSEEIIPNARPIDFNKGNGGKWFPPGIGESELIIKSLFNQGYFPTTVFHDFSKFINSWTTIRKYRNKATHTDLINENQFFELNSTFDFLRKEEYF